VETRKDILDGGVNGPAVIPRRSGSSNLVRKLGPNPPFGVRMPQGGPYLSDAQILRIADWIDQGARDSGPSPDPPPSLSSLLPARTAVGDTVRISGTGFGESQETSRVLFAAEGGGRAEAEAVRWSETEIAVLVPAGAAAGDLVVSAAGGESNALAFDLAPALVSFQDDLVPLFQVKGCISCHGGTNNLYVTPHASLMSGDSDHGPVVIPRRSVESVLWLKLTATPPFGDQMPLGSDIGDEGRQLVADWIDQGARDN
jgi:hypothetical protein